jgi:hypothetical protein
MTVAEDAANELRRRDRVARPFRVASLILFVVAVGVGAGLVVVLATVVVIPLAIWAVVAADRSRYRRKLSDGVSARAGAGMRILAGGRRWIGVLSVERGGVRWAPSKRFRKRGARDVFMAWDVLSEANAARVSPPWTNWMARTDVLVFGLTDGTRFIFSVTSPQVIYAALAEAGHGVPFPSNT